MTRRALFQGLFQTRLGGQQLAVKDLTVETLTVKGTAKVQKLVTMNQGPSRLYLSAGFGPADTVDNGETHDAVVYVENDELRVMGAGGKVVTVAVLK